MKIIIDSDPGIDDIIAIMLAIKSRRFDIMGITTVEGNCSLINAIKNTFKVLDLLDSDNIPVYKGSEIALNNRKLDAIEVHGANGIGGIEIEESKRKIEKESATKFLIKTVNENPGEITIVAMGPLTNIAHCIMQDNNFIKNVKKLVIMGGAENDGNVTEFAEFNFYKDPEAADIVFKAGFKEVVMIGLDVTTKLPLSKSLEQLLKRINNDISMFIYDISRIGAKFDREVLGKAGFILNDPLTIAYLLDENIIKTKNAFVKIEKSGEQIGRSIVKTPGKEAEANSKVACEVDIEKFYNILFSNLFPENKEDIIRTIKNLKI
ncbi:MAG: nucleoside hydrolase [Tissierellia bacterium]|nr:nucleoside hydrolase [Tissierellia bacterium]